MRVVRIPCMNKMIRELAVGVEWSCGLGGQTGPFGFERQSGWKLVGSRQIWHVLWHLPSQRRWKMMGQWDTIHLSTSLGGKVNSSLMGMSKRSLSKASTLGSYL